jgi:DNA-binding XRE family transcriptional regulator
MAGKRLSNSEIERLKELTRICYIKEGISSQKELAERVGVTEKTMGKWIKENKEEWDKLKKNLLLTRSERMSDLFDELTELQQSIKDKPEGQRFADSKQGDVRRKLIKDIKELETKAATHEIVHALMSLINFVREESQTDSKIITKWADIFIKSKL